MALNTNLNLGSALGAAGPNIPELQAAAKKAFEGGVAAGQAAPAGTANQPGILSDLFKKWQAGGAGAASAVGGSAGLGDIAGELGTGAATAAAAPATGAALSGGGAAAAGASL